MSAMTTTTLTKPAAAKSKSVTPVVGRVAQVLNARELVINIGSDAGVTKGRRFKVLAERALEVKDPETGEVLDAVDREKTRVEATEVRPKIAICRTYRIVGSAPWSEVLALTLRGSLSEGLADTRRPETLHVDDSTLPPPLPPEASYVSVNDRVVSVDD